MTSVPWAPGNFYGNDLEPRYIAISYTWGRWRLKAGVQTDVEALQVNGITWDMPRVDPSHFTAADFKNIVQSVAKPFSQYKRKSDLLQRCSRSTDQESGLQNPDEPSTTIEYVWIDVACIDQTNGSAEMAVEIGRQAKIFKGATMAFIWLTTLSREGYRAQYARNKQSGQDKRACARSRLESKRADWDAVRTEVEQLSLDPWFSSLWTLQEAYLCPRAVFMTREGEFLVHPDSDSRAENPITLERFVAYCELHLTHVTYEQQGPETDIRNDECLLRLRKALEMSGMTGLTWQLPITLFVAAQYRRTTREEDRVYGIMQVFDFRLGKSRPGVDPKHVFKMPELEDELGKELLEREPIMSQMHVFAERPSMGKGWRIARSSKQPRNLRLVSETDGGDRSPVQDLVPRVHMSTVTIDGIMWGHFSGKCCSFRTLIDTWNISSWNPGGIVDLDGAPWAVVRDLEANRQEALDLSRGIPDAVVLLLGIQDSNEYSLQTPLGLLLAPCPAEAKQAGRTNVWRRLGLCEWSAGPLAGTRGNAGVAALYEESSGDWVACTGIFG